MKEQKKSENLNSQAKRYTQWAEYLESWEQAFSRFLHIFVQIFFVKNFRNYFTKHTQNTISHRIRLMKEQVNL